ncbi:hypothetical protein JYT91_01290, partial [archaeon AH-315-M20]|nr:hypothetical protein [archaeon AH-315-M20]
NRTDFVSRLIVHNKGCADASSITFKEVISTGWTAFAPTMDGSSAGVSDIPKGEVRYSSDDFGTIKSPDYKILAYKVLPPSALSETGTFKFNLTWGTRDNIEDPAFEVKTIRYEREEHLAFDIIANGSFNDRSAEPLENQSYNLTIKNIGDIDIRDGTWNITLATPENCSISNHTGTFYEDIRKIAWDLGKLSRGNKTVLSFKMNCTEQKRHILTVEGIRDNRSQASFSNVTSIGCSGSSCTTVQSFTFTKPSDPRYEKLSHINFNITYNWTDTNVTIGQGFVNITDDVGAATLVWQEYSFTDAARSISSNYTFDADEQAQFIQAARDIGVRNYVDATSNPTGNVTVEQLDYTWDLGKIFNDSQSLFINIQPFVFVIGTPVLTSPLNNSNQASSPIVLTWDAVTAQAGGFISYFVFADATDATTLQTETNDTFFQFKTDEQQETFFWRVRATDGTQNGSFSETRQFSLDQCTADADFSFALKYPMNYNNVTDKITIWGSNGTDYDPMGQNESNATTFEHIFEFGKAVRGICAVQKPATGSYVILSKLDIGNTSSPLNRTFLKTAGESIDFGKQVQLKFNATFISGELTDEGSPFAGSTLSFSGTDANETNQGQLFTLNGSTLDLRDSFLLHKLSANDSTIFRLFWNGRVVAKRSSLESWYTIRFVDQNNSLEDIVITNVGEGFYPAITQFGTLDTIKSRKVTTAGLILAYDSNATIKSLEVSEVVNDIKVINYTGIANLINAILNFSNINWTTGSFSGSINRRYDYTPTITDADGVAVSNVSLIILDIRGDTLFELRTDSSGTIPKQTITRSIYDYSHQTGDGDSRGPHTLNVKIYGKNFQKLAKEFSAATVETAQLSDNTFTTLNESAAKDQTGIIFDPPKKISFGDEVYGNFNTTGTLNNTPITQSEFFAIFGTDNVTNNTKLTRVTDTPDINGEFSVNFETGVLTFFNNQNISDGVTAVYSSGGNITIANGTATASCKSMKNIYDFMQANLSDVITTVDGITYNLFVDLVIGNGSSKAGCIIDADSKLSFKDGYTYSFSTIGGYIDLFGQTEGGGAGGLPLNIRDAVGSQYNPGDSVEIFSFTFDSNGVPKDSTITITIRYPNATDIYVTGTSKKIETGFYRFNKTLESDALTGTYSVQIDAVAGTDEVHDTVAFKVEAAAAGGGGGAGGLPLNIFNTVGTIYRPGETVRISSTVVNSSGVLVNATVNVTVRNPDDTILNTGSSTLQSAGRYEYSFVAPSVQGTYSADIDANLSADEIHDTEVFIVRVHVGNASNGTSPPRVHLEAPAVIDINTKFDIVMLATDDSGLAADCTDTTANITIRDTLTETDVVDNEAMGKFGPGLYNYTYNTSAQSTFVAIAKCTILNVEYVGITVFSTQDVAGTGGTSGGVGGLPLNIFSDVGTSYSPNDEVIVFALTTNASGFLVSADVNVSVFHPNGSILNNGSATENTTGIFRYNFTLSDTAPIGTYQVKLDANFSGDQIHDILAFQVKAAAAAGGGGAGGLPLNIFNTVGTIYDVDDRVRIFSTTVNSSGALVNASVNVSVFKPDGSLLNEGKSSELSLGRYEYNFTAPATEGTYRADINANFSGDEIHDIESFIVIIGGAGGNGSFVPQVQVEAPAVVDVNIDFSITALTTNKDGIATNCADIANLTIRDTLNGTEVIPNVTMERFGTGLYNYTYSTATQSTYMAIVKCTIKSVQYVGVKEFSTQNVASTGGGGTSGGIGGLPLNIFSDIGTFYSPNDEAIVFAIITNGSGALVSADLNVSVNYPNQTNLTSGFAFEQSTGTYNFSFILPSDAPSGTYHVRLDANFSGDEIHDILAFVISATLEGISTTVNNINTTVNTINENVITINTTVNNIQS